MKVVVTGTRGIPRIMGGVETHCEQLYTRLAAMGIDVTVIRRKCYVTDDNCITEYRGVKLVDVYAPRSKSLETLTHTVLAVYKAWRLGAEIIHIHAVGSSIVVPIARLLGMKVVCTNHGADYKRQKWGALAKRVIRFGEWCQAHYAHQIIAISPTIATHLREYYGRTAGITMIPNGVPYPTLSTQTDYITSLGVEPQRYVVALARFVPEKRLDLLIHAFAQASPNGYSLVLAGDADHKSDYSQTLKRLAQQNNVVLTGFIQGEQLNQLMSHAALFVLPSNHEGMPISLLEAMSYHLDVLVSDIDANRLPQLLPDDFFPVDNCEALMLALKRKLNSPTKRSYDLSPYDWDSIARQTLEVYKTL